MTCTVNDCAKPARTRSAKYCDMHYYRMRRTGKLTARAIHALTTCSVPGCGKPEKRMNYCSMHEARVLRHGSPDTCIEPKDRAVPRGEDHPFWAGDECGYPAAHDRVRRARGPARRQRCIECGEPAKHWSYNRAAQAELTDHRGRPYSARVEDYDPRCVSCHKLFDLAALGLTKRTRQVQS